jgi:hypothetical protein
MGVQRACSYQRVGEACSVKRPVCIQYVVQSAEWLARSAGTYYSTTLSIYIVDGLST